MIEKLIKILGSEILICKELVNLALQKREFIINNEAEKLTNNLAKAEQLVKQVYQLKEDKVKLFEESNVTTMNDLLETFEKVEKTRVNVLLVEKRTISEDLRKEEKLNQRLVENQLDVVKFMLNMIKPKEVIPTYNRRGVSKKTGNLIGVNFKG
ncbi:flagellar protein FlgN [bacterium]|nr:flagellar protein FlgN [bacterium]